MTTTSRVFDAVLGVALATVATGAMIAALNVQPPVPFAVRLLFAVGTTFVAMFAMRIAGKLIGRAARGR